MERPRLLFVDDAPSILHGLENALFDREEEWDLTFLDDPFAAAARVERGEVDILISDMRMPGLDGRELMLRAQEHAPAAYRIMLSGTTEWALAEETLTVAHEFLSKPCGDAALMRAPGHGVDLVTRHSPAVRQHLGRLALLPPRPALFDELSLLAVQDASADRLVELLELDVGLSAKLLHLAHTAFFSGGGPIHTVADAVQHLGVPSVRRLVESAEAYVAPTPQIAEVIESLNAHSVQVAERAAAIVPPPLRAQARTAGLLHDVGELIIAQAAPALYHAAVPHPHDTDPARLSEERRAFGFHHAELGAALLQMWNIGGGPAAVAAHHHGPARGPDEHRTVLWAVYLAALEPGADPVAGPPEVAPLVDRWRRGAADEAPPAPVAAPAP